MFGSEVAAIFAISLMSGNIKLPGFATADSFLGARSSEAAGQGLADEDAELRPSSGQAYSNAHVWTPAGQWPRLGVWAGFFWP